MKRLSIGQHWFCKQTPCGRWKKNQCFKKRSRGIFWRSQKRFLHKRTEESLSKVVEWVGVSGNEVEKMLKTRYQKKYVKSTQLTANEIVQLFSSQGGDGMLEGQAKCVVSYQFQQAINCCQITAIAYALTCLGYPTTVDDIFLQVGVNVDSAVGDGMTLAEAHELAARYIHAKRIPIFVDCYHFDEGVAGVKGFERAVLSEGASGIGDVLAFNFHSGIAHGKKKGGGHFSIFVGYLQEEQRAVIADVHPMKYGAFWSTPINQMYDAMNDKDSLGRSRGLLHFGVLNSDVSRPLPGLHRAQSLVDWSSPTEHKKEVLIEYIPNRWDTLLGCRNMAGVSTVALALRALEGAQCPVKELDDIMRALEESYTEHLNTFLTAAKIKEIATRLFELGLIKVKVTLQKVTKPITGESLRASLELANCGKKGVSVLAAFRMNQAQDIMLVQDDSSEAGALCHDAKMWSVLASFIPRAKADDRRGVVVATACETKKYGRMWTCSLENMAMGMATLGSDMLVVLSNSDAAVKPQRNILSG